MSKRAGSCKEPRPGRYQPCRVARCLETLSTWGLAALLTTLPFWRHRVLLHRPGNPIFYEFHDLILYTNDLLWWAAVGAWLLSRLVKPCGIDHSPKSVRFGPWFLFGPLLGFILLSILGIPLAIDRLYAAYHTLRLLLLLALYLLLVNAPLTREAVAWPLAVGMVLQALVAVPQFVSQQSLGLKRLGEVTVKAAWPGASVVMVGDERWLRAYGFTQHPNLLAGCLTAMLLVVAGHYLMQRRWCRLGLLVTLGTGLATLLLTFSRAAWLGLFAGGVMMLVLLAWTWHGTPPSPAGGGPRCRSAPGAVAECAGQAPADAHRPLENWLALGLLLAVLLMIALIFAALHWPLLQPRLGLVSQGTEIRSVEARQLQVPAALALIQMRPVLGVGLGNYPTALYEWAREAVAAYPTYQPVYNVALLVTAELGLAGGGLWLCLILSPWLALWLRRRQMHMTPWWAGLSGALLALLVISMFDHYIWTSHQGRLVLWLVLGLWARAWTTARLNAAMCQGEAWPLEGQAGLSERKGMSIYG